MSFISFMKDLGIVPNRGTPVENDPGLHQGQQFMDFNRMYTREVAPQYAGLQSTGIPGVGTTVEAMSSDGSVSTTGGSSTSTRNVTRLEDEFNRTIAEYNSLYKIFSEEMVKKSAADKEIRQYYGQAVTTGDGNYSYVNDYGYTHKYSNDAWSSNADNCPSDPETVSNESMRKFGKGPDMGSGQACGVSGRNVRNADTGENAWVDIKGYKHIYSSDVWASKQSSCDVPVTTLSATQYNAIPSGGPMTTTDYCMQLDVNPGVWKKLMQLNSRLTELAGELSIELGNVVVDDVKISMARDIERDRLNKYTAQLGQQQTEIALYSQSMETVQGEQESSALQSTAAWTHMIMWILVVALVVSITVRAFFSGDSTPVMDGLAVVGAIIVLYVIVAHWMSKSS